MLPFSECRELATQVDSPRALVQEFEVEQPVELQGLCRRQQGVKVGHLAVCNVDCLEAWMAAVDEAYGRTTTAP